MIKIDAIIRLSVQNGADPFVMNLSRISPYQIIASKLNKMIKNKITFIILFCLLFVNSSHSFKFKENLEQLEQEEFEQPEIPTSFSPGLSLGKFSPTAEQAFNYFYPGQISNYTVDYDSWDNDEVMLFPYLQSFSGLQNSVNPTFVCYDPFILLIMYYTQQNDIGNLINILQNNNFLKRKKTITTYQLTGQYLTNLYTWQYKTLTTKSNLDSWVYAGPANGGFSEILYPILILGQSSMAMQLLLENGASPNFLGYTLTQYHGRSVATRCNSALLYAIQQNNLDTTKILLQYGADPNIQNDNAYLYATTNSASSQMINLLQQFEGGKTFSAQATSSLQEAIKSANVAQIQSSFQQNANINAPIVFENEEMSILQYIILQPESYPKYNILNTLFNLTKGIAVNFRSSNTGTTALMAAVCIQDTGEFATCTDCTGITEIDAIIELLIQNGADPFAMNSNQISPYQVIASKLNNTPKDNSEYNFLANKLVLLINNMNFNLLTIGYYLYNLSLITLAENLNVNLVNIQSRNVSSVAGTQYKNLITSDKPTLQNIITIIKSFPAEGNWNLMRTEVDILKTIILNYLKLGGSFGALYNGNTILSAAQSTHNNHLANWIKNNFGNILTFIDAINGNDMTQISASLADNVSVDTIINSNGDTALIYACSTGNSEMVNLLLKYKSNINFKNRLGQTPLYATINNNNYTILQILISHDVNLTLTDLHDNSPLIQAILKNSIQSTTLLLQAKADPNVENISGQTPLSISLFNNNFNLANLLLSHKANINYKNKHKQTILSQCIETDNINCLNFLIQNKSNINLPIDANDNTALLYGCLHKNTKLIMILLKAAANTNTENKTGQTPLSIAIQNNNYSLATLLVKYGANFDFKNKYGQSALIACINNSNLKFINLLISNQGNLNVPINSNNDTALIYACNRNNANDQLLNILLKAKADPNIANSSGEIPLLIAINNNNYKLANLLLTNGADINFIYDTTNGKETLLTKFIMSKNIDIVKFLIKNKANINTVGINGKSAIQCYADQCDPYQVRWERGAGRSDPFCYDAELKSLLYNENAIEQQEEIAAQQEMGNYDPYLEQINNEESGLIMQNQVPKWHFHKRKMQL